MTNKGRYSFTFRGGVSKGNGTSSKFLLFHLLPDDKGKCTEKILYQSLKEGAVESHKTEHIYYTEYPFFKLFTLVEGFGIQRFFYSFYASLDGYGRQITILPLDKEKRLTFLLSFKGHILRKEEVKELIDNDSPSWLFYRNQVPLPVALLKDIVSISSKDSPVITVARDTRAINF